MYSKATLFCISACFLIWEVLLNSRAWFDIFHWTSHLAIILLFYCSLVVVLVFLRV